MYPVEVVNVDHSKSSRLKITRLKPGARIIMLPGAVDIPRPALKLIEAFVVKIHLTRELLSAISTLR
jgi:hypothetical protein